MGLKISCKIVQKNPRLLISLTISISQSNVLPLSKQRSSSLKATISISQSKVSLSPFFSSISIFLIISFSLCFLNLISVFFIFSKKKKIFRSPPSEIFFFYPIALFVFSSLSNPINFVSFSIFFFVLLSQTFFFLFFFQIAQCFFQLVYAKNLGRNSRLGYAKKKKTQFFFPSPFSRSSLRQIFFFLKSQCFVLLSQFSFSSLKLFFFLSPNRSVSFSSLKQFFFFFKSQYCFFLKFLFSFSSVA